MAKWQFMVIILYFPISNFQISIITILNLFKNIYIFISLQDIHRKSPPITMEVLVIPLIVIKQFSNKKKRV